MVGKNQFQYFLDKSRVVAHIDVDCFSVQVSRQYWPQLNGKPCATRLSTSKKIDCVSYEALEKGVSYGMSISEAKQLCPDIEIVNKEKLGSDKYEKASKQLFDVIKKLCKDITIEKTSVDDFYLDLTDKCDQFIRDKFTYDESYIRENIEVVFEGSVQTLSIAQQKSLHSTKWMEAAVIISDICDEIFNKTGLICSAGISHNKLLAKIGCKYNKPNAITIIVSKASISRLFENCPIGLCNGLNAKFGSKVQNLLKISTLKELRGFRRKELIKTFGKESGGLLWNVSRGIDTVPVRHITEFKSKLISEEKKYKTAINCNDRRLDVDLSSVCKDLTKKLSEDLKVNKRMAHRFKIEIFTKSGRNFNTIAFLMTKKYESKRFYETIIAKGFPKIGDKVPKYIIGFRVIPIDFKSIQNLDSISQITQQMQRMAI